MGDFNKILSIVLGLIVVIIFLAVVTRRLDLKNKIPTLRKSSATVSPTPTPFQTVEISSETEETEFVGNENESKGGQAVRSNSFNNIKETPRTGSTLSVLFFSFSTAVLGFLIRKRT